MQEAIITDDEEDGEDYVFAMIDEEDIHSFIHSYNRKRLLEKVCGPLLTVLFHGIILALLIILVAGEKRSTENDSMGAIIVPSEEKVERPKTYAIDWEEPLESSLPDDFERWVIQDFLASEMNKENNDLQFSAIKESETHPLISVPESFRYEKLKDNTAILMSADDANVIVNYF